MPINVLDAGRTPYRHLPATIRIRSNDSRREEQLWTHKSCRVLKQVSSDYGNPSVVVGSKAYVAYRGLRTAAPPTPLSPTFVADSLRTDKISFCCIVVSKFERKMTRKGSLNLCWSRRDSFVAKGRPHLLNTLRLQDLETKATTR